MKSTLTLISNLLKYIYLLVVFTLFAGKIYANGNIKLQVVQIILCILMAFAFSFFSKAMVKVGHIGSIFHTGTQRKHIYTIVLIFLTAFVWFLLFKNFRIMHFPSFNSDITNDLLLIVNLVNGFWPQTMPFWFFGIFFSAFCTFGILRTEPDLLSTLWLSVLVGLMIRGIFLGNNVFWFMLCLLSGVAFAMQYIRLLKKELYGEETMRDSVPKNRLKKAKSNKKNKKKGNLFKNLLSKKKKNKKKSPKRAQNNQAQKNQKRSQDNYAPYKQDDYDSAVKDRKRTGTNGRRDSIRNENRSYEQEQMRHHMEKSAKEEDSFSNIEQMLEKDADNEKKEAIKAMKEKKSFYE